MPDKYEIRKGGAVYASSEIKNLGYPEETLRQLQRAGYKLYCNGRLVKKTNDRRAANG